jgi:hypothetical protein
MRCLQDEYDFYHPVISVKDYDTLEILVSNYWLCGDQNADYSQTYGMVHW